MVNFGPVALCDNDLYSLHKAVGVLILGLMAMRIGYRLTAGAPRPPAR